MKYQCKYHILTIWEREREYIVRIIFIFSISFIKLSPFLALMTKLMTNYFSVSIKTLVLRSIDSSLALRRLSTAVRQQYIPCRL